MGTLSFEDANIRFTNLVNAGGVTLESIVDVVRDLDIAPPAGSTIVLYTGRYIDDLRNSNMALGLVDRVNAQNPGSLHMIDLTGLDGLFGSPEFLSAMDAAGYSVDTPEFNDAMNGLSSVSPSESVWGAASENYVSSATGNAITFTNDAAPNRIFSAVELKTLFETEGLTAIDGLDKAQLITDFNALTAAGVSEADAYARMAERVSDKSLSNTFSHVKFALDTQGNLVDMSVTDDFFDMAGKGNISGFQGTTGAELRSLQELLSGDDLAFNLLRLEVSAQYVEHLKTIGKYAGPLGDLLEISLTTVAVKSLIDAGDYEGAQNAIMQFQLEFAGGSAGAMVPLFIGSMASGGGIGPTIALLTLGIAGGYIGSETAGEFADMYLTGRDGVNYLMDHMEGLADIIRGVPGADEHGEFGFVVNGYGRGDGLVEEVTIYFRPYDTTLEKRFTFRGTDDDVGDMTTRLFSLVDSSISDGLRDIFEAIGVDLNEFAQRFAIDKILEDPEALTELLSDEPGTSVQEAVEAAQNEILEQLDPDERAAYEADGTLPERVEERLREEIEEDDTDKSTVIDFSGGAVVVATTENGLEVVRTMDENGLKSVDVNIAGTSISLGQLGSIFGSHIGRMVAGDNPFEQIAAGSVFGIVGNTLFESVGLTITGEDFSQAISDSLADADTTIVGNTAGAVGSYLVGQLLAELGIDGLPAQAFNTAAGTVINNIISNIQNGSGTFAGATDGIGAGLSYAGGTYLGALLANELVTFDSEGGQIGGSIGGAAGGYIGNALLGESFSSHFGFLGNMMAPGVGYVLGFVLGGIIGDFVFGGVAESGQDLVFDPLTGLYRMGAENWSDDGADEVLPVDMASAALSYLNVISNAMTSADAAMANPDFVNGGAYGQHGEDYSFWTDGENSSDYRFETAQEAIEKGLAYSFSGVMYIGGDLFVKRAFYNYLEQSAADDSFTAGGLLEAINVGYDFSLYQASTEIINGLLVTEDDTAFAAGWIITFAMADGLNLKDDHISDFFGGLGGYLNGLRLSRDGGTFADAHIAIIDGDGDGNVDDLEISFATHVRRDDVIINDFQNTMGYDGFTISTGAYTSTIHSDLVILDEAAGAASMVDAAAASLPTEGVLDTGGQSLLSDDIFVGNSFNNTLDGGAGWDWLDGGAGDDSLIGGAGEDVLLGRDGEDTLEGGAADDYLSGGAGSDHLIGGDGNDTLEGSPAYDGDTLDGSQGIDTVSYAASNTGVYIDLASSLYNPTGADVLINIENTEGSTAGDYIVGSAAANALAGLGGDDRITGGNGNDTLDGGKGGDELFGGDGTDTYVFNRFDGFARIHDQGNYNETDIIHLPDYLPGEVTFRAGSSSTYVSNSTATVQDLIISFEGTADQIVVTTGLMVGDNDFIEKITFGDGTVLMVSDIIAGLASDTPAAGDDILTGTTGDDTLEGGAGNDTLHGGTGNDTYVFSKGDGQDAIEDNGHDADLDRLLVHGYHPDEVTIARLGASSNDLLLTFEGTDDRIVLFNALGRYSLTNSLGDQVSSVEFDDGTIWTLEDILGRLFEQAAENDLDVIVGTNEGDTIAGGLGDDFLFGGSGDDLYVFNRGDGQDVILDNDYIGDDELRINGYVASDITFARLNDAGHDLIVTFAGTSDRIIIRDTLYNGSNSNQVEKISLEDGTEIPLADVWQAVVDGMTSTGDDYVYALAGVADTLMGGTGNDTLVGRAGADTYVYRLGDGNDIIEDNGSYETDTLQFTDIARGDVSFSREGNGNDLRITISSSGETVLVVNTLSDYSGYTPDRVENYTFSDGTSLTISDIRTTLLAGGSGDDSLAGWASTEDTLTGGAGNDTLSGLSGDDTYVFNAGDGVDTIIENGHRDDDVLIINGYFSTDATFTYGSGGAMADLTISFVGSSDSITLVNSLEGNENDEVETVIFSDGTVTMSALRQQLLDAETTSNDDLITGFAVADNISGAAGNDTLIGNSGGDTLTGGAGDDSLQGGAGADRYVHTLGDGSDTLADGGTSAGDRLVLHGIAPADVFVALLADGETVTLTIAGTGDVITMEDMLNADQVNRIEEIVFDDGTVWGATELIQELENNGYLSDLSLVGTSAADTLEGGLGDDTLEGRDGSDTYVFSAGGGHDYIEDNGFQDTDRLLIHGYAPTDVLLSTTSAGANDLVISFAGSDDSITIWNTLDEDSADRIEQFEFDDGTVWSAADIRANLLVQQATDGDDHLYGFKPSDTLEGGLGNDTLIGKDGSDTYVFSAGDGQDVIQDDGFQDTDRLVIHGYAPADVLLSTTSTGANDLVISFAGNDDSITIWNTLDEDSADRIEQFEFDDGTVWSAADIRANLLVQQATNGDDHLYGFKPSDTLEGGLGNDTLIGKDGSDTYVFSAGDGQDVIQDDGFQDTDRLVIHGYAPTDVLLSTTSAGANDLVISFAGSDDSITIWNTLDEESADRIEQFVFDDGAVWSAADIRANLLIQQATDGDDHLYGFKPSDTLDGGLGNDTLMGRDGSDTYVFSAGDGQDVIEDNGFQDTDRLVIHGYDPEDVSLSLWNGTTDGLVLTFAGSSDRISIWNTLDNDSGDTIEEIVFDDGTVWTMSSLSVSGIIGTENDDTLTGTASADSIAGNGGNDFIDGLAGDDTLMGGNGDDTLSGGTGADSFDGGEGNDTADFSYSSSDYTADLSTGIVDWYTATAETLISIENLVGSSGDNIMIGSDGNNRLDGYDGDDSLAGGAGDDTISGGVGTDTLDGGAGIDTLDLTYSSADWTVNLGAGTALTESAVNFEIVTSGSGNDTILGSAGADTLSGGSGNDVLNGAGGNDILTGGNGADSFAFSSAWGEDTVTDFEDSLDIIDMSATGLTFADLTVSQDNADVQVVDGNGNMILIIGTNVADITIADFVF